MGTGQGGTAWAASLRVRIWPEYPECYLSDLIWASKPDCGISTTRKASCNLRHRQARAGNKGLNRDSRLQDIPLRWQAARAGRGQSQPQRDIIYKTVSRLLCQLRLLGVLDSQHPPEKVRWLYTQITEWQGGDKSQQPRSPNTLSPELLDLGRAQNTGLTESAPLKTTQVLEPEQLRSGRCKQPRAGHGWFLAEQPRAWAVWAGRLHAPWAGAGPVWLRHCEHMPVLFVCSVPPSPQCNWTSEPK